MALPDPSDGEGSPYVAKLVVFRDRVPNGGKNRPVSMYRASQYPIAMLISDVIAKKTVIGGLIGVLRIQEIWRLSAASLQSLPRTEHRGKRRTLASVGHAAA